MLLLQSLAILCSALLIAQNPYALAQTVPGGVPQAPAQPASPQQLDSLVAPIALYPDPIVSQVLVASTYPLEIAEAARWLGQHPNLQGQALADAVRQQNWDPSVQGLVATPDLLSRLNQNLTWTSQLGNAFLSDQAGVMDAIQRMRQRAEASGALKSTPQQTVSNQTENGQTVITIQPAGPDVLYVPIYNPVAIWGPADYYPYPSLYYPPYYPGVAAAGLIGFGTGVFLGSFWGGGWGWGGWGWRPGWGSHRVFINNNFIVSRHFNRVATGPGNAWVHNPIHRGGLGYNNPAVANRFPGAGAHAVQRPTMGQVQQRLGQQRLGNAGQGAANRMAPGNFGQRGVSPNIGSANRMAPGNLGQFGGPKRFGNVGGANRSFGGFNQGGARALGGGGFHGFQGGGFRGGGFRGGGFHGGGFHGGGRRR